jgi:hypothetical protein
MGKAGTAIAVGLGVLGALAVVGLVSWGLGKAGLPIGGIIALPVRQAA